MDPKTYSIAKLKAGLSAVINDVAGGGEIVVTDHNKAVARIVPVSRVPPLPRVDVASVLASPPLKLRPDSPNSAQLIRAIRNEE